MWNFSDREPLGRRPPFARAGHRTSQQWWGSLYCPTISPETVRFHGSCGPSNGPQSSGNSTSLRSEQSAWPSSAELRDNNEGSRRLCGSRRRKCPVGGGVFHGNCSPAKGQVAVGGECLFLNIIIIVYCLNLDPDVHILFNNG